jgi:thioredoxin 1
MKYIPTLFVISITLTGILYGRFIEITSESEFNSLMADRTQPIIIKFAADWCGACQAVATPFKEVAEDSKFDYIDFYHINIDKMAELTKKYGIIGVPTFIFINNTKEIQRESGVKDVSTFKKHFTEKINELFKRKK